MDSEAQLTSPGDEVETPDGLYENSESNQVEATDTQSSPQKDDGQNLPETASIHDDAEESKETNDDDKKHDVEAATLPDEEDDSRADHAEDVQGDLVVNEKTETEEKPTDDADVSNPDVASGDERLSVLDEESSTKADSDDSQGQEEEFGDIERNLEFSVDAATGGDDAEQVYSDQEPESPSQHNGGHATGATTADSINAAKPDSGHKEQDQNAARSFGDSEQPPTIPAEATVAEASKDGTERGKEDSTGKKGTDQSKPRERHASSASTTSSKASGKSGEPKKQSSNENETKAGERSGRRSVSSAGSRSSLSATGELQPLTSKEEIEQDLERMRERKETEAAELRKRRAEEKAKVLAKMEREKRRKGITIFPETRRSRHTINTVLRQEEVLALEKEKAELDAETKRISEEIDRKYAISIKAKAPDLVTSAAEFFGRKPPSRPPIPQNIRRHLTLQEIEDLKLVFDMFDVRGRGHITSGDLKRAAGMLGFKADKKVFKEMIAELPVDHKGRVTFPSFLDFVIRSQGDGPDPLDDIIQGFRLLDKEDKGYLTFADLRASADELGLPLSNRALREMLQEADSTGSGQITLDEFVHIMLQTSKFKAAV